MRRLAVPAGPGCWPCRWRSPPPTSSSAPGGHWLLHQQVGWGVGLAAAALVVAGTGRQVPAAPAMMAGQLLSIVPDLQFRYARMPHEPSMDLWLGHISLHTGPSPVLVALAVLLLGGWA